MCFDIHLGSISKKYVYIFTLFLNRYLKSVLRILSMVKLFVKRRCAVYCVLGSCVKTCAEVLVEENE